MELQIERLIPSPPGPIAELLADLERRPEWAPGCSRIELGSDGYTEELAHEQIRIALEGQVVEPGPERFRWAGVSDQVDFARAIVLAPEGAGTRVTATYEVQFKSLALALMEKRIQPVLEAMLDGDVRGIETLLGAR